MQRIPMWLVFVLSSAAQAEVAVSVLAGYRFGNDLAVSGAEVDVGEGNGAAMTLHYFNTASSSFDLWLSRIETDTTTGLVETPMSQESIQFGGRTYWRDEPFYPYVGATVGMLRLSPDLDRPERETRPAFTLFTGLALPIAEQFHMLVEARWIGTVFSSDTTIRCDDTNCEWKIKSGTWSQYEVGVGVTAHF